MRLFWAQSKPIHLPTGQHTAPTPTVLSYPTPRTACFLQIQICPHWLFEATALQGGQLRALGHHEDTVPPGLGRQRQPGPSRGTAGPGCSWNCFLEFSFMSYSEDLGTASKWIIPLRLLQALAAPAPKHVLSAGSGDRDGGDMGQRSGQLRAMGLGTQAFVPSHSPPPQRLQPLDSWPWNVRAPLVGVTGGTPR